MTTLDEGWKPVDAGSSDSDGDGSDMSQSTISDEDKFVGQLQACLDDVQYDGTFYSSHSFSSYINPGLYVTNYGSIGLPLSIRDAEAIARISKPSPFGKGDQTMVDTTIRKTWELDATSIECQNPAWTSFLDGMVKQAIADLGVQVPAHAEPYKLLLYEEGAFFKAHRDSEKSPGMFGTMVICLPSEHHGGEVHLTHGGKTIVLETATHSPHNISTLAWYSDVKHEIKPVVSGYRLVLTYNLLQQQSRPRQTALMLDESHARLERLLRIWNNELRYIPKLIYPLEHQYTEASLSRKNLKGHDAAKARYIESVCANNGFFWFLGNMVKETEIYEDEYEDGQQTLCVDSIVTPTGRKLGLRFPKIVNHDIVVDADDLYAERDADSEDEAEHLGNESSPTTLRYHDTVIILVRKADVVRQFNGGSAAAFEIVFELFRDDSTAESNDISARDRNAGFVSILNETMQLILRSRPRFDADGPVDFGRIFTTVSNYCYHNGKAEMVHQALHQIVENTKWTSSNVLMDIVARHIARESRDNNVKAWDLWLSRDPAVLSFQWVDKMRYMFDLVRSHLQSSISAFDEWKASQMHELLHGVNSYDKSDALALMRLITEMKPEIYFQMILPTLINKPDKIGLANILCELWTKSRQDDNFQDTIVRPTYRRILQETADTFTLSPDDLVQQLYAYKGRYRYGDEYPSQWLRIINHSMNLGLHSEALHLIKKSLPDLPNLESSFWKAWRRLLSFLNEFASVLESHHNSDINKASLSFMISALRTTAYWLVKARPIEPKDWRRASGSSDTCDCEICRSFRQFLGDPDQAVGRFDNSKKMHLKYRFNSDNFIFETEGDETGSTLVVRKTSNEFLRLTKEWKADISEFESQIKGFNTEFWTNSLGDERDAVLEILHQDKGQTAQATQSETFPSAPATTEDSQVTGRIAGVKRKAEVLDANSGAVE